jgi:glutamyl/glutaminyl-tRNA synthetase
MPQPDDHIREHPTHINPFTSADVLSILQSERWLTTEPTPEQIAWAERAAALLGHYVTDRQGLRDLLQFVFTYDAAIILQSPEAHAAISRQSARDVIRHLALLLLDSAPLTSDRFQELITKLKTNLQVRSRDLFHPIRLALAGYSGEGEFDRIILLLDEASTLPFAAPVKSSRTRILEFCSALD